MDENTKKILNIFDQMFDLPCNITNIELSIGLEHAPALTVTYFPDLNTSEPIAIEKKFEIQ